jgi:hypothetical protein
MGRNIISRYDHLNDFVCCTLALLVCNVNIINGNLESELSEDSPDYAKKPQQNFKYLNSASGLVLQIYRVRTK